MTDTHTHIYFPEYDGGPETVVERAMEAGVKTFILPNVDESSLPQMRALHEKFPENTFMAIGLHPTEIYENWESVVESFEKELQKGRYIAVGEVGMDLYWEKKYLVEQKKAFERQLRIAEVHKLPVIIHTRDALNETLDVLLKVKPTVPLVFHSFTGSMEDVKLIRENFDPYFGINGVVTYKNAASLRDALPYIGIDRILLETDSPYLPPVPHRGERNDSRFLPEIAKVVAEIKGTGAEEIARLTMENGKRLFQIG